MLKISVQSTIEEWAAKMKQLREEQIPKVIVDTLNNAAFDARAAVQREIDEKTTSRPWIRRGVLVGKATLADPRATIYIAQPQLKYLYENIVGGSRGLKTFEDRLRQSGVMPSGMYAVPGPGLPLDAYGSPRRAALVAILQSVSGVPIVRNRKSRRPIANYFVLHEPHNRLRPGIYQKKGVVLVPMILFVSTPPKYRKRVDFYGVIERTVQRTVPDAIQRAFERAQRVL